MPRGVYSPARKSAEERARRVRLDHAHPQGHMDYATLDGVARGMIERNNKLQERVDVLTRRIDRLWEIIDKLTPR